MYRIASAAHLTRKQRTHSSLQVRAASSEAEAEGRRSTGVRALDRTGRVAEQSSCARAMPISDKIAIYFYYSHAYAYACVDRCAHSSSASRADSGSEQHPTHLHLVSRLRPPHLNTRTVYIY